jgi:DNA-binding transcriptional ArsR family regulator
MAQHARSEPPEELPREALRHPLRLRIVAACYEREVTPKEIADQEKLSVRTINNHFRALEKANYIRRTRSDMVNGLRRHFYVAMRQALLTDSEFAQMPMDARREASGAVLRDLLGNCREALLKGTLDARPDSHLTWSPLTLDQLGWEELMSELTRVFERSTEIEAGSLARLRKSGERPIPTTIALAGFERPVKRP